MFDGYLIVFMLVVFALGAMLLSDENNKDKHDPPPAPML